MSFIELNNVSKYWSDVKAVDKYLQIHEIIQLIPRGKVATYGQIAEIVGGCTARMVGYAASAIPVDSEIPWQRVINYKGKISSRSGGSGELLQQELLEGEGIQFDQLGKTNLKYYRWNGETELNLEN